MHNSQNPINSSFDYFTQGVAPSQEILIVTLSHYCCHFPIHLNHLSPPVLLYLCRLSSTQTFSQNSRALIFFNGHSVYSVISPHALLCPWSQWSFLHLRSTCFKLFITLIKWRKCTERKYTYKYDYKLWQMKKRNTYEQKIAWSLVIEEEIGRTWRSTACQESTHGGAQKSLFKFWDAILRARESIERI